MIINIQVLEEYENRVSLDLVEKAALAAFQHQNIDADTEITIVIQGNDDLQALNSEFRGVDAPTDVLAFSADEVDPDTGNRYLGDIAISYPYAQEQALNAGHAVDAELQLLAVHGVLHLLGMDHIEPADTQVMWNTQYQIMDSLGIDIRSWPLISGGH